LSERKEARILLQKEKKGDKKKEKKGDCPFFSQKVEK
jgi:hypothetical protein